MTLGVRHSIPMDKSVEIFIIGNAITEAIAMCSQSLNTNYEFLAENILLDFSRIFYNNKKHSYQRKADQNLHFSLHLLTVLRKKLSALVE